ncbi:MAG: organic solvent tolerance transporter substrate-binding protein [Myxococcales bacterium]|nr:organic solvent tolerance transporter substrate-binding protein [Myxococcales bacterium]
MPTSRSLAKFLTLALALGATTVGVHAEAATKKAKTTKATATATTAEAGKAEPPAKAGAPAKADAPAGTPTPPPGSPMAELKKQNLALDKVLQKNLPNWTPEAELQRTEVRKIVGSFLDYGELAKRSLARHWDTLTPKQREDFSNTLRELVERSYLRQLHGNANYNIKYEKEEKSGNEATVDATLHTMARGKKVEIALQYKMLGKGGEWLVYDVLTDEQSMLENYRAEFNKIITKDGFDALLKRMKKKLDEKEG